MKSVIYFSITLCMFFNCSNPSSSENNERFAFHLLENDTLTTMDVQDLKLPTLKLNQTPFITYDDIIGYKIENHKFYLNEKFSTYFNGDSLRIFSKIFGVPFVIVANGERIYLGSFYTSISSWLPNTPHITDFSINNIEKSFIISGAPIYDESTYVDKRNDDRIFQALKDKIIQ